MIGRRRAARLLKPGPATAVLWMVPLAWAVAGPVRARPNLADLGWERGDGGLVFRATFEGGEIVPHNYDRIYEKRYYYVDFHGAEGPAAPAAWDFAEPDFFHLKRLYYPEAAVLRLVFYFRSGLGARVEFGGGGSVFTIKIGQIPMAPLGERGARADAAARRRVVIDPGHGGASVGGRTSRPVNGRHFEEKEVALAIARRLEALFERAPNGEAVLTRRDDRYVPLEERVRIAEGAGADFFISIHLNASPERRKVAEGFEVYYLGEGTQAANRYLVDLENDHVVLMDKGLSGGETLRRILEDLADENLRRWRQESMAAGLVINQLFLREGPFQGRSRGVKTAAFRVLMNFSMPAVLVECGFLDNPREAPLLVDPRVQDQIAALLFNAINLYFARTDPRFQAYLAPVR